MADNVTVNNRYLGYNSQEVKQILKQVETLDNAPTEGSDNPIKSGGVAAALGDYFNKENDLATEESVRAIVSGYTPDTEDSSDSSSDSE